jgi:hypothetical protein
MNCLRPLERWGRGFESHSRHRCLSLFRVCVGSGLLTDWSSVQGVLPTVLGLINWSETKRFTDAVCSKVGATGNGERVSLGHGMVDSCGKVCLNLFFYNQRLTVNLFIHLPHPLHYPYSYPRHNGRKRFSFRHAHLVSNRLERVICFI